jgi:hypothetical protein
VTETKTQSALPGANVIIAGTAMGAATDLRRRLLHSQCAAGNYSLTVSMMGYTTVTKTGVNVSVDHTTQIGSGGRNYH